jgi:hypothetical protein
MLDFGMIHVTEDTGLSAGERPLLGSLQWTVEIFMRTNLTSKVILRSRDGDYEERTAGTIEELVDSLMAFAEERDITYFERKAANFLSEYLRAAGFEINFFDLLEVLQKRRTAKLAVSKAAEDAEEYQSGDEIPVWGSLIWTLEMKVKITDLGSDEPEILIMLTNSQTEEGYQGKVSTLRDAVLAYRDFFEQANISINDRRLARLLAEYFPRIGLKPAFREVLAYYRDPSDAIMEEIDQETLAPEVSQLREALALEDSLASLSRVTLKEELLDDELEDVMHHLLDRATPEKDLGIETSCAFTVDGETKESLLKAEAKEALSLGHYSKKIVLENTFESPMVDVKIVDSLPYDLELSNFTPSQNIEPTKRTTPEGLSVTWSIPEINSGEEFSVDYRFLRRISRVIVFASENNADTLTTFHSIAEVDSIGKKSFTAEISFTNTDRENLNRVIIRDILPSDFILAQASAKGPGGEDLIHKVVDDPEIGTQIEWSFQGLSQGATISVSYQLMPYPYIILSRGSLDLEDSGKVFFARIMQPLLETNEWVVTHSIELEGDKTSNLEIIEPLPHDYAVVETFSNDPNFERQTWEIREKPQKAIVSSFICYPFERSTLAYRIKGDSEYNPQHEVILSSADERAVAFSTEFINRNQSIFSPPAEHLLAYRLENK